METCVLQILLIVPSVYIYIFILCTFFPADIQVEEEKEIEKRHIPSEMFFGYME